MSYRDTTGLPCVDSRSFLPLHLTVWSSSWQEVCPAQPSCTSGSLDCLARLGTQSILQQVGRQVLLSDGKGKSWFLQVRAITQQYGLPDPLMILQSPPSKESWKRQCKAMVISFWEERLRGEATLLPSLTYFKPSYMSLTSPHPIWSLAESPFEISKASTVAAMISGRYVTDHRARHWSKSNPSGECQLCLVHGFASTPGTLEHQLLSCPALDEVRTNAISHWSSYMVDKPLLLPIVRHHTLYPDSEGQKTQMELLLDPSSCPMVISAVQEHGQGILSHLLYLSRTWCHAHHLRRNRILKLHNII